MTESAVAGNRTKTGIRKVAPWFSRVVMLPPAFVFTVITLRYFRDPGHAIAGMSLRSPEAFTDTRVIGAWMLTLLVLLMTFFVSKQRLWLGNLQLAVFMGATLALRIFGFAHDGTTLAMGNQRPITIVEIVFLALNCAGLLLQINLRKRSVVNP